MLRLANLALAGAALTVSLITITADSNPASPNVVTSQDQTQAPAQPPTEPAAPANASRTATGAADCLTRAIVVHC